jgi:hypothetical protein
MADRIKLLTISLDDSYIDNLWSQHIGYICLIGMLMIMLIPFLY